MDQQQIIENLTARAKALGLPMREVCARAGVAASTPSRWRKARNGMTIGTVEKLISVIDAAEAERRAAA